jgi:uncharacterized membrane protein (DUF2068 family)
MSEGAIQEYPERADGSQTAGEAQDGVGHHDRGLLAIGIFKLTKSAFFFCVGIGVFELLHKDLGNVAMRLAQILHRDPEGRFVGFLMEKVELVDTHHLRELGFFAFAYSALALTEGIGLMLEKTWAEFLTVGLTISFLPWELYELIRRPDLIRVALLVGNLIVLAYLLWLLRLKKAKKQARGV